MMWRVLSGPNGQQHGHPGSNTLAAQGYVPACATSPSSFVDTHSHMLEQLDRSLAAQFG